MNAIETQFGTSAYADFEDGSWTFEMDQPFKVRSGRFAIVCLIEFNKMRQDNETLRDENIKLMAQAERQKLPL